MKLYQFFFKYERGGIRLTHPLEKLPSKSPALLGLIYKTNKYKFDFQQYEIIRSFPENIYAGKIYTDEVEEDQSNLIKNIKELIKNSHQEQKQVKQR